MAIRRSKKKDFPKLNTSSIQSLNSGEKKKPDMKKLGIIGGASVGAVALASVVLFGLPSKETDQATEVPNNTNSGSEWGQDFENDGGFGDWGSSEDSFNDNSFEPRDPSEGGLDSIEVGSLTEEEQLAMSNKWYSLYSDGEKVDTPKKVSSTMSSAYTNVMGHINSDYAKAEQKKKEEANASRPSGNTGGSSSSSNSSNTDNSFGVVIGGGGSSSSKPSTGGSTGGSNSGSTGGSTGGTGSTKPSTPSPTPSKPNLSESLGVEIKNDKITNINDLKKDGIEVIEGSSLQTKLFDLMDKLSSKIIVDTQKNYTEDEIVSWITNEYSNKLLVTQLDYGYLEESNRFFYLEIDYNVTTAQMKELNTFAQKEAKSLSSLTDTSKILSIGKTIASMGDYSKQGKQSIFSPYTLYKHKYGVCQAYTSMGKIMLDAVGIKNGIATGVLNGESHSWNVVETGGEIYHVDFTLNDTKGSASYLNIADSDITKDRVVNRIIWN